MLHLHICFIITARVAKRAKVMFSQAFVCPSPGGRWPTMDQVTTPPPPLWPPFPPWTRSQHLPPSPSWDQVTTPPFPPGTRSQHLPPPTRTKSQHHPSPRDQFTTPPSPPLGPSHNTSLPPSGTKSQHHPPPRDQVTTPPPPGTKSQHHHPPWDQVTTPPSPLGPSHNTSLPPPGPSHNTSPSPWDQVTTPPSPPPQDHVTTPPSPPDQVTTPPLPVLYAGGRYASYWNAFLFVIFRFNRLKIVQYKINLLLFFLNINFDNLKH